MVRDTAVTIIQDRLGNRTGLETKIIAEMQLAQAKLEGAELLPWFLTYVNSALTLSGQTLALPTGFLREVDEFGMWLTKADGGKTKLIKDDYDNLQQSVADEEIETSAEDPSHYAIVGSTLYFFPTPTRAGVLKWAYSKADTVLSTNIENAWLANAPDILIAKTGIQVARFLRDIESIKLFGSDLQDAEIRLLNSHVAREQSGKAANRS